MLVVAINNFNFEKDSYRNIIKNDVTFFHIRAWKNCKKEDCILKCIFKKVWKSIFTLIKYLRKYVHGTHAHAPILYVKF